MEHFRPRPKVLICATMMMMVLMASVASGQNPDGGDEMARAQQKIPGLKACLAADAATKAFIGGLYDSPADFDQAIRSFLTCVFEKHERCFHGELPARMMARPGLRMTPPIQKQMERCFGEANFGDGQQQQRGNARG